MLQFTVNAAGMNTKTTEERDIFIVTDALCLKLYQDILGKVPFLPEFIVLTCTLVAPAGY